MTKEHRDKITKALREYWKQYKIEHGKRDTYIRTKKHKNKMSKLKTGIKMDDEFKKKVSENHADVSGENNPMYGKRGKDHPGWRGGVSTENNILRKSLEFRVWRTSVFERDNFTCIFCGKNGGLNADHIKPWSLYPKLRFDINNGRTLCVECHKQTDTYAGKMNRRIYEK